MGSSPSDGDRTVKSFRSHNVSLKVETAGEEAGKNIVVFFKSCLGFCLPGFFPSGECPALCLRLVLRNSYETIRRFEGVCEMLLYFES